MYETLIIALSELTTVKRLFVGVVIGVYFQHNYFLIVHKAIFMLTHSSRVLALQNAT